MTAAAPPGQEFTFKDGTHAASLRELLERLRAMPAEEFGAFVTEQKNDFATWTEHALAEPILAERLRSTTNKDITVLKIAEKIDEHQAQDNLVAITQARAQPPAPAREASPGAAVADTKSVNLALLHRNLLVKEFIIGIGLGVMLGLFLYHVVSALWFA